MTTRREGLGMGLPENLGDLVLTRFDNPAETVPKIKIEQADPYITIADEWLEEIRRPNPWASVEGGVVRISDDFGKSYTYRLVEYLPLLGAWSARWPD